MTRRPIPTAVRVAPPLFAMLCAAGAALAEPAATPATDPEVQAAVEAIIADGNLSIGATALIAGLSGTPAAEDATATEDAPAAVLADTAETPAPAPEAVTVVQAGDVAAPPLPDTAAALAGLRVGPAPVLSLPADIVALSAVTVTPEPPTSATAPATPPRPLTVRMGATTEAPPPARPFVMPWSTGVYR